MNSTEYALKKFSARFARRNSCTTWPNVCIRPCVELWETLAGVPRISLFEDKLLNIYAKICKFAQEIRFTLQYGIIDRKSMD